MKRSMRVIALICALSFFAACGGGSGGGSSTLTTARVKALYQLANAATPLDPLLAVLIPYLLANCGEGVDTDLVLDGVASMTDVACLGGGTWTLTGTLTCSKTTNSATSVDLTVTDTTGNPVFALSSCTSTIVTVDTDGDGTADITTVSMNGDISPFEFENITLNVTLDAGGDLAGLVVTGSVDATYSNMAMGEDVSATISYVNQATYAAYDVVTNDNPPTCTENNVSATEGGASGSCTIQADCDDCT